MSNKRLDIFKRILSLTHLSHLINIQIL